MLLRTKYSGLVAVNFAGILVCLLVFAPDNANAQIVEQNPPRQLNPGPTPSIVPGVEAEKKTTAKKDDEPLIPELRGIVFVEKKSQVRPDGINRRGVDVSRVALLDEGAFISRMMPFLGRGLKREHIGQISEIVTQHYRSINRPFVSVTIPPQEVTNGVLQILVIEFELGTLSTEGNRWTPDDYIYRNIRIRRGDPILSDILSQDLDWLNRNPFRSFNAIFQPGKNVGETDLRLRITESKPWQVYAGYSNTGTRATDQNRFFIGGNIVNLPVTDHQLGYRLTTSSDFWNAPDSIFSDTSDLSYVSHAATYSVPLPWRHILFLQGSFVTTQSELTEPFTQNAKSSHMSLGYGVLLWLPKGIKAEISAGFEYKQQSVDLFFDGTLINETELDIFQFNLGVQGTRIDSMGRTSLDMRLIFSPGNWSDDNDKTAFIAATGNPDAAPDYAYFYGHINRQTILPWKFYLNTDLVVQLSNTPLPGIEHIALGGKSTARGYEELEASGDDGIIITNELHLPGGNILETIDGIGISDNLSPYVFVDYGYVKDRFADQSERFLSTGIGATYSFADKFFASADYGIALRDGLATYKGDKRFKIQLTASY